MIRNFVANDNQMIIEIQNETMSSIAHYLIYGAVQIYKFSAKLFEVKNNYLEILEEKHSYQTTYLFTLINMIAFHYRKDFIDLSYELFRNEEEIKLQHQKDWMNHLQTLCSNLLKDHNFVNNLIITICEEKLRDNGDFDYSEKSNEASEKLCYLFLLNYPLPSFSLFMVNFDNLEEKYKEEFEI